MIHLPDRIYLQRSVSLPVPLSAFILFTTLFLKDDDFRIAPMVHDRRHHFRSVDYWRADFLSRSQYIQFDRRTDVAFQRRYAHFDVFFDAKLFAACFNNCE